MRIPYWPGRRLILKLQSHVYCGIVSVHLMARVSRRPVR